VLHWQPVKAGVRDGAMKTGFVPIKLEDYIKKHLKSNRDTDRSELTKNLRAAVETAKKGTRCSCGNSIWAIGSAIVGHACFTCITGESYPDSDYEIDEVCNLHDLAATARR